MALGMTAAHASNARGATRTPGAQPVALDPAENARDQQLSTLSGGMASSYQMLAPRGRERETNGTLTCMTAFVAFLVERLHVDLGRVSTAVCMAG